MGDPKGFYTIAREVASYGDVASRVEHHKEFLEPIAEENLHRQGARCMDCGVPFCHSEFGCPLGNLIPVWNELVHRGDWGEAIRRLHATNNFPEFTGRVCPAPCETACTIGINADPVTIKQIERAIIDRAWDEGWIKPQPAKQKTGKKVAVIGSGPAGMACAQQLARAGHDVTVYERDARIGGLLRIGIPDFKLEKFIVERRVEQMEAEGVTFVTDAEVGRNVDAQKLMSDNDAVVLCTGSTQPRDLPVPGRDMDGIHFAMDFLRQQNHRNAGVEIAAGEVISAEGKHVVVIGGGDTGADCVGTSVRQGAASITQLEILPQPPEERPDQHPWPNWPFTLTVSTSHHEAEAHANGKRQWCVNTTHFAGEGGKVKALHGVEVEWVPNPAGGRPRMEPKEGTEFEIPADLVLLAMGFLHPEAQLLDQLGVEKDARGNIKADEDRKQTSVAKVFAAGDCRRGQSLVVWAMAEGRDAAYDVDEYLMGQSCLARSRQRRDAPAWEKK